MTWVKPSDVDPVYAKSIRASLYHPSANGNRHRHTLVTNHVKTKSVGKAALEEVEPKVGVEPTTCRLRMRYFGSIPFFFNESIPATFGLIRAQ